MFVQESNNSITSFARLVDGVPFFVIKNNPFIELLCQFFTQMRRDAGVFASYHMKRWDAQFRPLVKLGAIRMLERDVKANRSEREFLMEFHCSVLTTFTLSAGIPRSKLT